jgi:hypothetical protein
VSIIQTSIFFPWAYEREGLQLKFGQNWRKHCRNYNDWMTFFRTELSRLPRVFILTAATYKAVRWWLLSQWQSSEHTIDNQYFLPIFNRFFLERVEICKILHGKNDNNHRDFTFVLKCRLNLQLDFDFSKICFFTSDGRF